MILEIAQDIETILDFVRGINIVEDRTGILPAVDRVEAYLATYKD